VSNPPEQSLSSPEVSHSVLGAIRRQCCQTCAAFVTFLRQEDSGVVQPTKRWCERRESVNRVQDRSSMKPRFRNTNLLILHVLDSCVKLLLCGTYQVHSVNQWTSEGFEASDDGMKQIAKK